MKKLLLTLSLLVSPLAAMDEGREAAFERSHDLAALERAIQYERVDSVRGLLEKGVDPNDPQIAQLFNREHDAPIQWFDFLAMAVATGNVTIVQMLLEKGAFVNKADNDGETAFHVATGTRKRENFAEIADLLVKHGANKDAVDRAGHSPLYMAVQIDHRAAAKKLIELGAKNCDHVFAQIAQQYPGKTSWLLDMLGLSQ